MLTEMEHEARLTSAAELEKDIGSSKDTLEDLETHTQDVTLPDPVIARIPVHST